MDSGVGGGGGWGCFEPVSFWGGNISGCPAWNLNASRARF